MIAADLMRPPVTVTEGMSAWAALALMRENTIRHVLVVGADDGLRGVVSNRDYRKILERLRPDGTIHGLSSVMVAEIMTPAGQLVTGSLETSVREIARWIVERRIGCVPILAATGLPAGIVTQKDVIAALLRGGT